MTCLAAAVSACLLPAVPAWAQAQDGATASAATGGASLPAMKDRGDAAATLPVRGFRVRDVGNYPDAGIDPARIQAVADAAFAALAKGQPEVALRFDQLQAVADTVTQAYRSAGFIVSTAYLPAQTPAADRIVEIRVLEGRIGQITVQGAARYRGTALSAPLRQLQGRPLRKQDVDTALLYARDLPGVSLSSVLQPGQNAGETDVVLVASEATRPYVISLGGNNYGTELTGRYRAQAGITWNSPLGLGDVFAANYAYSLSPRQSQIGALSYALPVGQLSGLSAVVGASRSELEVRNGVFARLGLRGPTAVMYAGADWKFINQDLLQLQASARYLRETSRLEAAGLTLSDQSFDVAELGASLRRTDLRWRGVDLLQLSVRQALRDGSADPDLVSPDRDSHFTLARLSYTRLQYLTRTQRLYFKFSGQYSDDTLAPLEQFAVGGPDSVRSYPVSDALGDRGYYTALEYHVDAPGCADVASPFNGRPWRELLELDVFADHARVYAADGVAAPATFDAAGVGFTFRLPQYANFEWRLTAALPTGSRNTSDGRDDARIYTRFGFTF
ncbi:ShlB/FhaC/HecB family hemolysin secretion/activation protein [Xanthomonas cassavae CFBP 4642]|uniref:ShlB/FhaC/HecB family hemolysin secretion/activation protein n=3 Tax=Xanthomonas cassavae TaxID=56450 RepID=A0ABS8HB71_9XANT|nr:ShlB/FhaC/HecB family hemolysin secretion/activation protein [Xanthomonas cassavae]MCC4619240.1 ShlB/FhaC/HecB family hemolysin secretion/activation protein [Xanthomonas cassavae CFBP 4642]